jgi:Kelch motif/Galactose oxidase, central domain
LAGAVVVLLAAAAVPYLGAAPAKNGARVAATGRLGVARAVHTATLLADGRVLIAGGCTTSGCDGATARTEFFEAHRQRFVAGPPMLEARDGHGAVRLRSGKVLVFGGWVDGAATATAELFDPETNRFRPAADMRSARGGFSATPLRDGRVLIVGGNDGSHDLASAEVFDPATSTFTPTGSMSTPREAHAAVLLRDGRVAVLGGSSANGRVARSVEIWSPDGGRFSAAGELRVARHKLAATTLRDGRVLVVGGSSAADFRGRYASTELYDPATRSSRAVAPMRGRRFKILDAVAALANGSVLVAGGSRLVERYDPSRRRFTVVGDVGSDLAFATATRLWDGRVLIVGGYDDAITPTRRAWLYRPPR